MALGFNISAWYRCLMVLNAGFIFLLLGGPLAHADDVVYVSNTGAGTITQIAPNGNMSIFASGLNSPEGLAFDGAGNLFVADAGDGTISEINPSGNVSTYLSGLNSPSALTFAGGNLYVETGYTGGIGQQTILRIDSSRNASLFATAPVTFGLDAPYLASDGAGNIYANTATSSGQAFTRFDSSGNPTTVFGPFFGNFAEGMAVDGAGNLYRALQNYGGIYGNGSALLYPPPFSLGGGTPPNLDSFPGGLAFDANGNLFAYFTGMESTIGLLNGIVMEFDSNGDNNGLATGNVLATGIAGGTGDFGYIAVQSVSVQSVPEPGMGVLVSGLAVVWCLRRRP
jgi:hypothetical protein